MGPFGAMGYGPCGMSTGAGLQGVASVAIPFKKVIERKELHKHPKSFLILHGNCGNSGNGGGASWEGATHGLLGIFMETPARPPHWED